MSQSHLGVHLTIQVEDMNLRSCSLQGASVSQNLQVLVLILQQELCLGSGPLRIRRQNNASDGLQDLSQGQEYLLQAEALPVDPSDKASVHVLKEHHRHLAPLGLPLVFPVLSSSQGLVLGNVQDHRGFA